MKRIIFTSLSGMIKEKYGLETWSKVLDNVNLKRKGNYTPGGTCDDELKASILTKKYSFFLLKDIAFKEFTQSISMLPFTYRRRIPYPGDGQLGVYIGR
ncbi:MAG: hypothetical protein BGO67_09285 [Alphaproteobacteria bacterium 41-28]|nr:MAG: hypothetical protein BGO67_09285 [Alphaproteobacteria bacterium 41-28]